MSIKGLPITKCKKCGKTSLQDEYETMGCPNCHSTTDGVDFGTYRRRESLAELGEGIHTFTAKFKKVGNLHYSNQHWYALVEDVKCEGEQCVTNHAYIDRVSCNSVSILKSTTHGSRIEFKAAINQYNKRDNKWGFTNMHHIVNIVQQ